MCDTEDGCCAPPKESPVPVPTLIDTLESFIEGGSCLPPVSSAPVTSVAESGQKKSNASVKGTVKATVTIPTPNKSGQEKSDGATLSPESSVPQASAKNEIQKSASSAQTKSGSLVESDKKETSQKIQEIAGPPSGGCGGCCSGPVVEEETDVSEDGEDPYGHGHSHHGHGHSHGHAHEFYDEEHDRDEEYDSEEYYGHGHSHEGHGHSHGHDHGHGYGHAHDFYDDSDEEDYGHGHSHGGGGGGCCVGGAGTPDESKRPSKKTLSASFLRCLDRNSNSAGRASHAHLCERHKPRANQIQHIRRADLRII